MAFSKQLIEHIKDLLHSAAMENLNHDLYRLICEELHVVKMYYEMDLGD